MLENGLKVLSDRKLLPELTNVSPPLFEHCTISKQHRLKFNTTISKSKNILDLIYSDVWQALVSSLGEARYFISFIDDFSKRCWVYPIKKKSDVFPVFKRFKTHVELESGKRIKCVSLDNGEKYTGVKFDNF